MNVYDYPAEVARIIDGDTVILNVVDTLDFGFHVKVEARSQQRFRLARINCPEHDKPGGTEATAYTTDWLTAHRDLLRVTSLGQDNYGRWLGEIHELASGRNLNDDLLTSGHAVPLQVRTP